MPTARPSLGDVHAAGDVHLHRRRRTFRSVFTDVAAFVIIAVMMLVLVTPVLWAVVEFWRWVL